MFRPRPYAVDDLPQLHDFVRQRAFATAAAVVDGQMHLAYTPVVLDTVGSLGRVRFHVAGSNPLAQIPEAAPITLSFLGPDAYISPDWYVTKGLVPTWNYVAVEGTGRVKRLDEEGLRATLADLSASQEGRLSPKESWTMDKVPQSKMTALLRAIVGIAVEFETLEGKFKLSQDKGPADIAGVIAGLEGRDDGAPIAKAMRGANKT
jgi:transcriptional regulator